MQVRTKNPQLASSLYEAILQLRSVDEARMFFRDLLTEEEISEFSLRWQVAQLLDTKMPYSEIEKTTGMSSTTIARISKWLAGGVGGYRLLIDRVKSLHHIGSDS
ncbi:TrpR-like protein, YerC/YecD [Candidatus Microgenomates bacterium]|nr:TrpR-like protein, YerC/YecD [Candidatus Microgenomates bacterium]